MMGQVKSFGTLAALMVSGLLLGPWAGQAGAQTAKKLDCTGCVKSKQIKNRGIKGADIKAGTIGGNKLKNNTIGGGKIQDGSIGLGDLGFDPATQAELDNTDTLGDLICADGQVAKIVGGSWTCAADVDSAGDIGLLMTKIDNLAHLQASDASAYVFVTSETYTGNLGGVAGADQKCQTLADTAGLPGIYFAWIADSDPATDPESRFTKASSDYILPPGGAPDALATVAQNYTSLTSIALDVPINVTEVGGVATGSLRVWTNVSGGGIRVLSTPEGTCSDWSSAVGTINGLSGLRTVSSVSGWTSGASVPCDGVLFGEGHLYCFGQ